MVKVDLDMMDMAEEVLTMAAVDHVQDNRGHVQHLLVGAMEDQVARHLDLQADLEEEEDMEERPLPA